MHSQAPGFEGFKRSLAEKMLTFRLASSGCTNELCPCNPNASTYQFM